MREAAGGRGSFVSASGPAWVVLRLHVQPGASVDEVGGLHGGALRVKVRARAEAGKANEAVRSLLAGALGVRQSSVEIVWGVHARQKRVKVWGLTADMARHRLLDSPAGGRPDPTPCPRDKAPSR